MEVKKETADAIKEDSIDQNSDVFNNLASNCKKCKILMKKFPSQSISNIHKKMHLETEQSFNDDKNGNTFKSKIDLTTNCKKCKILLKKFPSQSFSKIHKKFHVEMKEKASEDIKED